jgi:hypothetical protein
MLRMIDRVLSVIDLCHFGDVVRGVVDLFYIWKGRPSLMIPGINYIHGLVGLNVTEMP